MDDQVQDTQVQNQEPPPKVDPQVEERARMQGWVPKEEFRGDKTKWISAESFVKRADEVMPILKSVNKKLETQLSDVNRKLASTEGMIKKMVTIQEKYSGDLYTTQLSEKRALMRKAAQEQDFETYDRLEKEVLTLKAPDPIKPEPPPSENHMDSPHPEVERWMNENKGWFGIDKEMTDYAIFVGEQLKNSKSPLATPGNEYAFCQEVEKKLKTTFPAKFSNPNRNRTEIDESNLRGGDNNETGGQKTWNDLPQDAKSHCARLLKEIPGYTKEKYLQDYYEGAPS